VNRFVLSSVVAALLASPVAFAGTSTDLKVKGTITPAACDVSLPSSEGLVDLRRVSKADFTAGEDLKLTPRAVLLLVKCGAGPARFWLKATDQAAASVAVVGPANYGLGMNGDKPNGYYTLGFDPTDVGAYKYVLKSTDGGASWGTPVHAPMVPFEQGEAFAFTSDANATEPEAIQTLSTHLVVAAILSKDPDVSEEVTIAGHATIEIFY
jgi:type 1 fimbria pilin